MELFKNKISKKYFICIYEMSNERLLMITPDGEVKPLEARLFEGPEIEAENTSEIYRYVNQRQLTKYNQYVDTLTPR